VYVQLVTRTKKMFVGGLSASTSAADVKAYFEQFGPVSRHAFSSLYVTGKPSLEVAPSPTTIH